MDTAVNISGGIQQLVGLFPGLLLGATLLGALAQWLGIPYATMLVLGGVLTAATHLFAVPTLEPDLLLFAFLPPLLFEAAFRLDNRELRVLARPMLLLAVPGTFLTALLVGGILSFLVQLPLTLALLFGSVVAATDAVAVVGVFRGLHIPRHLSVIAEGESLANDAVSITPLQRTPQSGRHRSWCRCNPI